MTISSNPLTITPYDVAMRFHGMQEVAGDKDNPYIVWAHSLCKIPDAHDELPWCSSWLSSIYWLLGLQGALSASARAWLEVGMPIKIVEARPGFDVLIFKRGDGPQPGPEVTRGAPGHVALFAGLEGETILALGGNQGNRVSIARFGQEQLLGVRRVR